MKNPHERENLKLLLKRNPGREAELSEIERKALARYHGTFPEIGAALGMLRLGDYLGWRPLVIIYSKRTVRKYEDILDIKIREFFKPVGKSADRSVGFKLADKMSNFWKAVSGDHKVEGRQAID